MQKIPTVFVRDPENMATVLDEWHPDCLWVRDGEGVATRKYDGTCVMLDGDGRWWARREVKPGKTSPPGFVEVGTDENTGKTMGWEPVEQSSFAKAFATVPDGVYPVGTYELCGPKVNGNPEDFGGHTLIRHSEAERLNLPPTLDYRSIRRAARDLAETAGFEGIVWHHPDGRMAKIKGRDFPRAYTVAAAVR